MSRETSPRQAADAPLQTSAMDDQRPNKQQPGARPLVTHANATTNAPDASLAFRALQFLPTPLLVLSQEKKVVLANRAMGKLLDVDHWPQEEAESQDNEKTVTEMLYGKSLDHLGIEMMQQGSLAWVSWDRFLDFMIQDSGGGKLVDDVFREDNVIDVVVMPLHNRPEGEPSFPSIRAKMIVSTWTYEGQLYTNLSFTAIPRSRSSTMCSDASSLPDEHHPHLASPAEEPRSSFDVHTVRSPVPQDTISLPSLGAGWYNNPSIPPILKKVARMKDALIDEMELPVYVMWHDGSIAIPNRAGWEWAQPVVNTASGIAKLQEPQTFNHQDLLSNFELWTEDFSRKLEKEEFPLVRVCKTRASIQSIKFGMHDKNGRKKVFDCSGKPIYDKSGEYVAGLIWMRDVTDFTEQLESQAQDNDLRFRTMCDCMPQLIWTTTPEGTHDYFSKRWYDYTGMKPEDSLGLGVAKGWPDCYHPDDCTLITEKWKQSLATGNDYAVEYRCKRHDGVFRWMLGRALALRDPKTNSILKWYGTTTDIHDLVEARSVARATREQLLEVLSHGNMTLWACNRERKITLMEGGTMRDTVGSPEAFLGREVGEVFGAWPDFSAPLDSLLNGDKSETFTEMEMDGRWFKTKYVTVRGRKGGGGLFDPSVVTGVIGLSLDATDIRRTEQELEERARQNQVLSANESAAKEASKLKSEFLASMSHEIRTPIAGVVGMAEILLDTNLRGEQREFAENISRSANALLTVINDILDISKVESGRMDIEEVQFNLSLVIRDVVKMMSFDAERKKLKFDSEVHFRGDQDLTVMGDPGRIRQILMNLLSNSMKFTNDGFVQLKACIVKDDDERTVVSFVVQDSGIGIDEEVQRKLFQPFTQADSSTARRFGGTGLGLTISKNLVDLMGGEIGLSSSIGEGTTAHFSIPFRKPQYTNGLDIIDMSSIPDRLQSDMSVSCRSSEAGISTPPESPMDPTGEHARQSRKRSQSHSQKLLHRIGRKFKSGTEIDLSEVPVEERKRRHVLVVEDNEINKQIAIRLVKKLNFNVSAVSNGLEALEFLSKSANLPSTDDHTIKDPPTARRPDIILMDVQMPEMDGYTATRAIRSGSLMPHRKASSSSSPGPDQRPKSPRNAIASQKAKEWLLHVPIVAMTASAIQGDKEKCRDAGMDDYLAKPVRGNTLEKVLVKWCATAAKSRPGSTYGPDEQAVSSEDGPDKIARGRDMTRSASEPVAVRGLGRRTNSSNLAPTSSHSSLDTPSLHAQDSIAEAEEAPDRVQNWMSSSGGAAARPTIIQARNTKSETFMQIEVPPITLDLIPKEETLNRSSHHDATPGYPPAAKTSNLRPWHNVTRNSDSSDVTVYAATAGGSSLMSDRETDAKTIDTIVDLNGRREQVTDGVAGYYNPHPKLSEQSKALVGINAAEGLVAESARMGSHEAGGQPTEGEKA